MAGNIPQYDFRQTQEEFKYLEDATPVDIIHVDGDRFFFADGRPYNTAHSGQGFPIGFDFRFGGQVFDQFAINDNGYILFGKGRVSFNGYSNLFFGDATRYGSNHFYVGLRPGMFGIKSGDVSYKLEGEEGNRTMTIEFAHMNIREDNIKGNAVYSLQIVLNEADNSVDINFLEEEAPYVSNYMMGGLAGWENSDRMLITGTGIGEPLSVAKGTVADITTRGCTIPWSSEDLLGETHDEPYSFRLHFSPEADQACELAAPTDLNISQVESSLNVSCKRTDGAGTMILISDQPFTDEDMPAQGISYQVKNDNGTYVTKFGNATLIYYGQDEEPQATFPKVKASTRYYVRALSVNGYPNYNTELAELSYMTAHPAPSAFTAEGLDGETIRLNCENFAPVIIAATQDRVNTTDLGETGIFGVPTPDAQVGDEIEGGGTIVYIGDPGEIDVEAPANRLTFYRAWTLLDGAMSTTYTNTRAVPAPSFPYAPMIEDHTLGMSPMGWTTSSTSQSTTINSLFTPVERDQSNNERTVMGVSTGGTTSALLSPALDLPNGGDISFEWAMETVRPMEEVDPSEGPAVHLPEGNKPGEFGLGHKFIVSAGVRGTENEIYVAEEYTGTMTASPTEPDKFISGTSTFIQVEKLPVPANAKNTRVRFAFSTEGLSYMYLRKIVINSNSNSVELTPATADLIMGGEGCMTIQSANGGKYDVYSLDGRCVMTTTLNAGETAILPMAAGIYVAGGEKVIVK